jgi:hypothetical protein
MQLECKRTVPQLEREYLFVDITLPPSLSKYIKHYPAKVKDSNKSCKYSKDGANTIDSNPGTNAKREREDDEILKSVEKLHAGKLQLKNEYATYLTVKTSRLAGK